MIGVGLLWLTCDSAWAAPDGRPTPVSYDLGARWTPANRTLEATETISLRDDGPGNTAAGVAAAVAERLDSRRS